MTKSALTVLYQVPEIPQLIIQVSTLKLFSLTQFMLIQGPEMLLYCVFEVVDDPVSLEVIQVDFMWRAVGAFSVV